MFMLLAIMINPIKIVNYKIKIKAAPNFLSFETARNYIAKPPVTSTTIPVM